MLHFCINMVIHYSESRYCLMRNYEPTQQVRVVITL